MDIRKTGCNCTGFQVNIQPVCKGRQRRCRYNCIGFRANTDLTVDAFDRRDKETENQTEREERP